METITNGDIRLKVHIEGEGEPVLLLHGFPDSHKLWRYQVPALAAAGYRVIAPDLRGFGQSDRPINVDAYAMTTLVGDVAAILDQTDAPAAHIIGHDWGAILAWVVAGVMPARVRSLTALAVGHPGAFFNAGIAQREKSWYMLLFLYEGLAEELLMADDWAFTREFVRDHPELEHWAPDLSRDGALTAALNWYRANVDPRKPQPAWPRIGVPTMGVWSSGDHYLVEAQMRDCAEWMDAPFRYERIDGASHWMQVDVPGQVNALLLDWLASQG